MASKYISVILALSVVQLAQSAELDKRGLLDSIPLIGPLLQDAVDKVTEAITSFTNDALASLGVGVTEAESIVQNYTDQATAENEAAKGPLESLLQSVIDKIKSVKDNDKAYAQNSTMCLVGQKENAESIVQQAAKNIFGCTQAVIQDSVVLFADIQNLNNQGKALAGTVPQEIVTCFSSGATKILRCMQDLAGTVIAKFLLLLSSVLTDAYKLTDQGIHLPANLTQCGVAQVLKATAEVGTTITNIGECMKTIAQIS